MFNPERPPEISAQRWLNSDKKRTLKAEKGKVVVVAIWQLTCPGSQKYRTAAGDAAASSVR